VERASSLLTTSSGGVLVRRLSTRGWTVFATEDGDGGGTVEGPTPAFPPVQWRRSTRELPSPRGFTGADGATSP
jgi:hypothetical protein